VAGLAASEEPVYGVTTGFGALATVYIPAARREELQRALIRSHAAGIGDRLEREVVRAMMLLRARTLAMGCSGARPVVAEGIAALLNAGLTPVVPEYGSLGASGDLAPLAHLGLVLVGEGRARHGGETLAGGEALRRAGLEPAFDRLVLFERWVTPALLSRRFDARFFFARAPSGQTVHPQEGEVTDWLWIAPRRALDDDAVTLVYATRAVLESVATGEPATRLMARARRLKRVPVIEPRLVETPVGWTVVRD